MFLTLFLILAAKLLFLLASIAMQNVAVCGIRNWLRTGGERRAILLRFALSINLHQDPILGLRFGNLTPSPILPNLLSPSI